MKNKSCKLDIILTTLLKEILPASLHTVTQIIHLSLTKGDFNEEWKIAIVRTLLKKFGQQLIHKNYRPVSNLLFSFQTCRKMHTKTAHGSL